MWSCTLAASHACHPAFLFNLAEHGAPSGSAGVVSDAAPAYWVNVADLSDVPARHACVDTVLARMCVVYVPGEYGDGVAVQRWQGLLACKHTCAASVHSPSV